MNTTSRLVAAEQHHAKLLTQKEMFVAELNRISAEVGQAKYRTSLKPQVDELLTDLQRQNHQRTVGMYEALLTQVMQEVLPNESKKVSMVLGSTAGSPSLDIVVERKDGETEDILLGNGGSISNVISTGLRFIALSRTSLRKFIVLDESDCWLETERVASFANVAAQMGADLGVQSLMISHHDVNMFAQSVSSIVSLTVNEKERIDANYIYDLKNAPQEGQLEYIRLVNFMSHDDTTIPLSAGMTAIIGKNDIGKSAIVTAISAFSGLSAFKKEFIKHGTASSSIFFGFVGGNMIECTRYRKGERTVIYRMTDANGQELHKTETGEPVWLEEILGVHTESNLDIQVGNQKSPIFLLDQSGPKQAAILSVGRESSLIASMQAEYKKDMAADRQIIKTGEERILSLRKKLDVLETLSDAKLNAAREALALSRKLSDDQDALAKLEKALTVAEKHHAAWIELHKLSAPSQVALHSVEWLSRNLSSLGRLQDLPTSVPKMPVAITLTDTSLDINLISRLEGLSGVVAPKSPEAPTLHEDGRLLQVLLDRMTVYAKGQGLVLPASIAAPSLGSAAVLSGLLARLERNPALLQLPALPNAVSVPALKDAVTIGDTGRELQSARKLVGTINGNIELMQTELNSLSAEHDAVVDEIGGICPLCHNTFGQ